MGVLGYHRIPKPKPKNPKPKNPKTQNPKTQKPKTQKVLMYSIYFNHKIDFILY